MVSPHTVTDSDSESSFSDQDISAKGAGRRGASHALTGPSDPAVRNCSLLRTARELRAAALFRSRSNTAGQRSSNGAVSADPAFDLDEAYGDGQTKLDVQIEIVLTRLALPAPRSGSVSGSGSHSADCAEDKNAPENYFSQDEQSRYERRLSIIADELARLGCHVVTGTRTFAASAQRTSLPASNGSVTSAMRPLPYPPQLRIPSLAAAKKGADDGDGDAAAEGEDGGEAAAPLIFPTLPKPLPPPTLRPSDCLNLDLSALVALASDITHGPLPPCSGLAYPNTDSNANSNSNCKVEDPLPDATVLEALFRQSASWKAAGAGGAGAGSSDNLPGSAAGSEAASEELSISTESHPRKLNLSKASAGRRTEEIPPPASSSSGKGTKQHGRALADQLFREMDPAKAFLQVVVDGVLGCVPELELEGEGSEREGTTAGKVRLYTTEEARDKFGDIMQLVAGATEKRRARALFGIRDGESFRSSLSESRAEAGSTNANASVNEHLETNANAKASGKTAGEDTDCVDAFWIGSRWAGSDARSVRIRRALVLPVQVLPSSYSLATSAPLPPSSHPPPSTSTRTFTPQMITALQLSLSDLRGAPRAIPISEDTSRPPLPSSFHRSQPTTGAGTAARQTPHTLRSLLRGAQEGMTTLTTNIASVSEYRTHLHRVF